MEEEEQVPSYADILNASKAQEDISEYKYTESKNQGFTHTTYKIKSLNEYIEIINVLSKVQKEANMVPLSTLIYRGMSSDKYTLEPSISRKTNNLNLLDLNKCEYNMVNEFIALRPEAFKNCATDFELLSKMQHHGLPTRLLDFTFNPLIALYFACDGSEGDDGRVVMNATDMDRQMVALADPMCSFYKHPEIENLEIENIIPTHLLKHYFNRTYVYNDGPNQIIARPKYWNERQSRQESVFMIFTNHLFDNAAFRFLRDNNNMLSEYLFGIEDLKYVYQESISSAYPDELLERISSASEQDKNTQNMLAMMKKRKAQLIESNDFDDYLSFDKRVRRESIARTMDYYDRRHECPTQLMKRFKFEDELKLISQENMEKYFVSILIDSQQKKSILSELNRFGIKKSFVYPELEYLAEDIFTKYKKP